MSSTKAPAMKQRLNKKVNQNRRVPQDQQAVPPPPQEKVVAHEQT